MSDEYPKMIITTCKFIEVCHFIECPEPDEDNAPDESTCHLFKAFVEIKKLKAMAKARRVK